MDVIAKLSGDLGVCPLIKNIHIENFRCYKDVSIDKCGRVNLIVGDNGVGKTALLEAIFLALGASPEIGARFRGQRGLDANMSGSSTVLENAVYKDLFYNGDMDRVVRVSLSAKGPAKRSVMVRRNRSQTRLVSVDSGTHAVGLETDESTGGLKFTWTNDRDHKFEVRAFVAKDGLRFEPFKEGDQLESQEDRFYYLAANLPVGSADTATRFSDLDIAGRKKQFLDVFCQEFTWIKDMSVQMNAGAGMLYATVDEPSAAIRPLGYISGGINKIVNILLCVSIAKDSVVLVDEVENGIHHKHHAAVWRMLFDLAEKNNSQIILTTHSSEWLDALTEIEEKYRESFCLWRVERSDKGVSVEQFGGKQAITAIEAGSEVR
jgi:ABC-type lipoprotein export system ATPase subunit